jgi:hypothetical protein
MQAVNRKAEGMEPRNAQDGKDDAFEIAEVNMGAAEKCPNRVRFSGV